MSLRRPLLAQFLLFVGLLGGLGIFSFGELAVFGPISLACTLFLYGWLALSVPFDSRWILLMLLPLLGVALFAFLYAYVFAVRTGAPLLPSLLAQREYVYLLLGPIVYALYLQGWKLPDFQRLFLSAALVAVAGLVVYDVTVAPTPLLLSGGFVPQDLGDAGEEAGTIRLVEPSIFFLALYFGRRLFQTSNAFFLAAALLTAVSCVALLVISVPRGSVAATIVALVFYAAVLSRPGRTALAVVMLPAYLLIAAIASSPVIGAFVDAFGQDQTYLARVNTTRTAWQTFREYPVFGAGQDSAQSIAFQDIYGQFYPSDVGLLGVAFQFGLVGLALYLVLSVWLIVGLLRLVWALRGSAAPEQSAFLWALLILCLSFLVASPLQAKFVFGVGLTFGAFSWGLLMAYRHGLSVAPTGGGRVQAGAPGPAKPGVGYG